MKRITLTPRENWQQQVESEGLTFHTLEDGRPYWNESAAYEFTSREVDMLEAAANNMQTMCLAAAQHVIDNNLYAQLEIPTAAVPLIEWAWNQEPPALYGRFDFSYDGASPPKLLEYNADTPTSLLEAAVIQWSWLEAVFPQRDQFNSIHDKLIAKWKDIDSYLVKPVYFAATDTPEDQLTIAYLRDTAEQAGIPTRQIAMLDLGFNPGMQAFTDLDENKIESIFKLYPWETMLEEQFAQPMLDTYKQTRWIEPIWKLLLSNKGILPILWQLYTNHENLLPAFFETDILALNSPTSEMTSYVRKPIHGREGANITRVTPQGTTQTDGTYAGGKFITQALAPIANFAGNYPVLGLWMVDQDCAGLGIRESLSPITGNLASFIPHYFI